MKILFVGSYDSANQPLVNLIRAFQAAGHKATVCSIFGSDMNDKIFIADKIPLINFNDISTEEFKEFDAVCLSQTLGNLEHVYRKIREHNLFTFTLGNLFLSKWLSPYADMVFCLGDNYITELSYIYRHNWLAIGNPQYDSLIDQMSINKQENSKKQILFIEQGLYPVGSKGKRQLAQLLIDIANRFQDCILIVKPRYLISEKEFQIHKCHDHIYYYIDEICVDKPNNLILLNEYINLEELIIASDCVITPWSTAYIEAGILGKELILISGLHSEDCIEVRSKKLVRAYEKLQGTGCVVNYTEVCEHLFTGQTINEDYLKKEIYDYKNKCSNKIVKVISYIYEKFIKEKRYFPALKLDYENYKTNIDNYLYALKDNHHIQDEVKYIREIEKIANHYISKLTSIERELNFPFSKEDYELLWGKVDFYIKNQQINSTIFNNAVLSDFKECFQIVLNDFLDNFYLSNMGQIMSDKISQAYMIRQFYQNKNYDFIIDFPYEILAKKAYLYYYGRVMYDRGFFVNAIANFREFLQLEEGKKYNVTFIDNIYYIQFAQMLLGLSYIKLNNNGQYNLEIQSLMSDSIQVLLFKELFRNKDYELLMNFKYPIKARDYFSFYYGRVMFDCGDYEKAINYLEESILLFNKTQIDRTADGTDHLTSALFYCGVSYYNLGRYDEAQSQFIKCCSLTKGVHKKAEEYLIKCAEQTF